MATLTVRLPAAAADRAQRQAAWHRTGADTPRRARPLLAEVFELQPPRAASAIHLPSSDADDSAVKGWFDSTWELQQGLDVAEGLPADLPLEAWLQVYLQA